MLEGDIARAEQHLVEQFAHPILFGSGDFVFHELVDAHIAFAGEQLQDIAQGFAEAGFGRLGHIGHSTVEHGFAQLGLEQYRA